MTQPWLKKNPFMSMWLSTANRMVGSMRGAASSQVKRQVQSAFAEATNENIKLSSEAVTPPAAKSRPKRRRGSA